MKTVNNQLKLLDHITFAKAEFPFKKGDTGQIIQIEWGHPEDKYYYVWDEKSEFGAFVPEQAILRRFKPLK